MDQPKTMLWRRLCSGPLVPSQQAPGFQDTGYVVFIIVSWDFPGGPVAQTVFPIPGAWVPSRVRELGPT